MSFEKLLGDLESLQALRKSAPADDGKDDAAIAAAAADGAAVGQATDPEAGDSAPAAPAAAAGEEAAPAADAAADAAPAAAPAAAEGAAEGEGDEDGAAMGKSFRFVLDSGEEMEAVDGTKLVKSLLAKFETFEGAVSAKDETLTKALGAAVDLIKAQGEDISNLRSEVARLASEGRGRKTVVSVTEKPEAGTMQKAEPAGVTGEEFMAKCLTAQAAGRLTALDVSKAEGYLAKGLAVPAGIVKRVLV